MSWIFWFDSNLMNASLLNLLRRTLQTSATLLSLRE